MPDDSLSTRVRSSEEPPEGCSLETIVLPAPPSCIVNTPLGFIIGTYTIAREENDVDADRVDSVANDPTPKRQRTGSLCIVKSLADDGCSDFQVLHEHETQSAVLDIVAQYEQGQLLCLAVATSTGCVEIWEEDRDGSVGGRHVRLRRVRGIDVVGSRSEVLVMKLAVHPNPRFKNMFAVALSDGTCALVNTDNEEEPVSTWSDQHSFQVWDVVWVPIIGKDSKGDDEVQSRLLMSGGDDAAIKMHVAEEGFEDWEMPQHESSYLYDSRTHESGVTALLPLTEDLFPGTACSGKIGDLVITGSYDEHIRLLRIRAGRRWEILAEKKIDGAGVWRLLPMPWAASSLQDPECSGDRNYLYILASCMHVGARVIKLVRSQGGAWKFEVVAKFTEHESMNYASTVLRSGSQEEEIRIEDVEFMTTSFYDRRLCVWKIAATDVREAQSGADNARLHLIPKVPS